MRKFIDLTGQKFGKLTIINQAEDKISKKGDHFIRWNCQCDCGESYIAYHDNLLSGATTQCKTCRYKQTASSNRQLNNYEIKENYGIGYTTNSKFFFDKKDYNLIKDYTWFFDAKGYVVTQINKETIYLHRLVLGLPTKVKDEIIVDHINGKKNDNRKSNLRICSFNENNKNLGLRKDNNSGVPGVTWEKDRNKWKSQLICDNKIVLLKRFDSFEEAVIARIKAELQYFGEQNRRYNQYCKILDIYIKTGKLEIQSERWNEENPDEN